LAARGRPSPWRPSQCPWGQQASFLIWRREYGQLEALKRLNPGNTLWRVVVDGVARAVVDGRTGPDALLDGVTNALLDRGARGVRQVEEHYLRRTDESRAHGVRARMEDGMSRAPIEGMARRVLGLESSTASQQPQKLQGLDDGMRL
jgi:hypothetical protein